MLAQFPIKKEVISVVPNDLSLGLYSSWVM